MIKKFKGVSRLNWIAGLLLAVSTISWMVYQQWFNEPAEIIQVAYDEKCDLRAGPCETILEDGSRVSFAIEPRSIPVIEKLELKVSVSGLEVDAVTVDINGVEMKMPPNIISLKELENGHYTGNGALSFCTRSIMEWESVIQLDTGNRKIKVPYRFITSQ